MIQEESNEISCPLCNNKMQYEKLEDNTHIWVCSECPAVLFEYVDVENITVVKNRLLSK